MQRPLLGSRHSLAHDREWVDLRRSASCSIRHQHSQPHDSLWQAEVDGCSDADGGYEGVGIAVAAGVHAARVSEFDGCIFNLVAFAAIAPSARGVEPSASDPESLFEMLKKQRHPSGLVVSGILNLKPRLKTSEAKLPIQNFGISHKCRFKLADT